MRNIPQVTSAKVTGQKYRREKYHELSSTSALKKLPNTDILGSENKNYDTNKWGETEED